VGRLIVVRLAAVVATGVLLFVPACGQAVETVDEPAARETSLGSWRFESLELDGQLIAIERPLFLDITEEGFHASTTCNDVSGHFGGELITTLMACPGEAGETERHFVETFRIEPVLDGEHLVFEDGVVRLVYRAFTDPTPAELFGVLGDPNASVDESMLPPEEATGTVPPHFDVLIPLPSPSIEIDMFLAEFDGNVCLVYGTATSIDKFCSPPRLAAEYSRATEIPIYEQPLLRVAIIPDRFAPAADARSDLGSYASNILILHADAPQGVHNLIDDAGNTLRLDVPAPWTDPMAASRTDPPKPSAPPPATTVPPASAEEAAGTSESPDLTAGPLLVPTTPSEGGMSAVTEGRVDVLADGCLSLEQWDGQLMTPIWPYGTAWDADATEIVLPDGVRIADGDIISAGGGGLRYGDDFVDASWFRSDFEHCRSKLTHGDVVWVMASTPDNPAPLANFSA
jgi:hypothetical protein